MEFNGTDFEIEVVGSGEAVVLLHAGICDGRMWDAQMPVLAEHYRVVRYDMRGYGKTAVAPTPYAHHDDLRAVLDYLHIDKAHLVGCSMGGTTALDFVLTHPQCVHTLTLVGSTPGGFEYEGALPAQWDALVAAHKAKDVEAIAALEMEIWVVGQQRSPEEVPPSIRSLVQEMNLIAVRNEIQKIGEEIPLDPPAIQRLAEVQAPTLLLVGDLDEPDILQAAAMMAREIPTAARATIHGTAHLPNLERPYQFNQILLDFLASNK